MDYVSRLCVYQCSINSHQIRVSSGLLALHDQPWLDRYVELQLSMRCVPMPLVLQATLILLF